MGKAANKILMADNDNKPAMEPVIPDGNSVGEGKKVADTAADNTKDDTKKGIEGISLDEVTAAVKAAVVVAMKPLNEAVTDVTKRQDSLEKTVDDKLGKTGKTVTDVQKQINGLVKTVADQQLQITDIMKTAAEQKEALEEALEAMKASPAPVVAPTAPVVPTAPMYTYAAVPTAMGGAPMQFFNGKVVFEGHGIKN